MLVSLNNLSTDDLESYRFLFNVLLFISTFAVIIGVYFESEEFPEEVKRYGWNTVARGVAGELLFAIVLFGLDLKISGRQNAEIATLESRTEVLRADNLRLQKILIPRRVFSSIPKEKFSLITALDQFKGTTIWLQVVPDFEAKVLANDILTVLQSHVGERVRYAGPTETNLEPQSILDGVSVHSFKLPSKSAGAGNELHPVLLTPA